MNQLKLNPVYWALRLGSIINPLNSASGDVDDGNEERLDFESVEIDPSLAVRRWSVIGQKWDDEILGRFEKVDNLEPNLVLRDVKMLDKTLRCFLNFPSP